MTHQPEGGRRILVIDGHPDAGSFSDALARAYVEGARSGGHDVRLLRLREMRFEPVLHGGFTHPQPLEPALVEAQQAIRWCQHLVIVTPCWWWSVPALLKGFIDRVFLPGFGVVYLDRFPYLRKLLKGRSARVIYTQNSPQLLALFAREDLFWRFMRRGFLRHCGFRPARRTVLAGMKNAGPRQRDLWLMRVRRLGAQGQ
ncbi:NAD(P)H-dependent oxidoreductase [Micromonospora coxensis]|uniref:Putative NADPH-quinone reductase (Modulator of drug activity B) n=1 Tax=Micromonospora coxensis TaxID=356852 RepID=A0A1C5HXA0_9ACTN|nr:NAD(P)H-dependent oxidoreductase [Micromonospora coxensis]SCG50547.1 Putative NADPH-quinone reductase (modulator of drug activity B) [Micromonospora coxensis]